MPAASKPTSRRAALRRVLTAIAAKAVSPADAGGVVYGVIVIGALLAAESGSHDGYAGVLESGLVAACLYWVAHAYANLLGQLFVAREHLTVRALARALAHDVAIVRGAAIPLLAVLIAWGARYVIRLVGLVVAPEQSAASSRSSSSSASRWVEPSSR